MSVLDDLKMIHERDQQDSLGVAEKQWEQLLYNFEIPAISADIQNIVYSGMGGSSLSALLSQTWPGYSMPFEVCRTYDIPKYVGKNTLFFAASFSGSTEETLSALKQAEEKEAVIVIIASGGPLAEIAKTKNYPFARLPVISQPRYGALYVLKAIVEVMIAAGLWDESKKIELESIAEKCKVNLANYRPDVPTVQNPAKQLALEIAGSSPVIYASSLFFPAA